MSRPVKLLSAATAIVLVHVVLRACGAAEHVSVLVGMPRSPLSWLIGPIHVPFTLAAATLAPILGLTAAFDAVATRLERPPRPASSPSVDG
jgi:hypothetical protein